MTSFSSKAESQAAGSVGPDRESEIKPDPLGSTISAGIDLAEIERLREHPISAARMHLTPEQFSARSVDFVPENKRAAARDFVASTLLISDLAEQNEHLYKFRLVDFNPGGEGVAGSEWKHFNQQVNLRVGVIRSLPPLDSTTGLAPEKLAQRNLEFIDTRHQEEALTVFLPSRALITGPEQLQHLHKVYDKNKSSTGRFESSAWDFFNRAANYIDAHIESGKPIGARTILEVNSLLQNGKILDRVTDIIRTRYDVMGVFRSTSDITRVFDQAGQYQSDLFSPPPMLGFCSRKQFISDVAKLLKEINEDKPELDRFRELLVEAEQYTTLNPHVVASGLEGQLLAKLKRKHGTDLKAIEADLKDPEKYYDLKRIQVLSSLDKAALKTHINTVLDEYARHIKTIVTKFGTPESLQAPEQQEQFQRQVIQLATEFGSVIDMGHFGMDGMGRTNLQLERLVMGQLGLTRPAPIGVTHEGVGYENGTYVPKNVRIDAIFATLSPLDVKDAGQRMQALLTSIRDEPQERLRITESDFN